MSKLEEFGENKYGIRKDLLENVNYGYRNNVKKIDERINKIDDDNFKNEIIIELYNSVCYYFEKNNDNEDVLLYLSKLMIKYNHINLYGWHKAFKNYKIIRFLFDNKLYSLNNKTELSSILSIPIINDELNEHETIKLRNDALCKYNLEVIKYDYDFVYEDILNNYDNIKDRLILCDIYVGNHQELLEVVCLNNLSILALKILEDEEKYINKLKKPQYINDIALQNAIKNNMVNVVFKIVQMRQNNFN